MKGAAKLLKLYIFSILLLFVSSVNVCAQEPDSLRMRIDKGQIVRSDSAVIAFLEKEGVPVTSDNRIKILRNGREKFNDLFSSIRSAKHHIHLEYFNFRNDSIGRELFTLLFMKAQQGVKVRVMFDAFGNCSNNRPLKKKHLKAIRRQGVEIIKFDPIRFPYINHAVKRDHRKIAVIDGRIAYTGGINVADYYIDGLPEIGEWHDMHIRIEGSAVRHLQEIFLKMWEKASGEHLEEKEFFPKTSPISSDADLKETAVAIVDRTPHVCPELIRHTYVESVHHAKDKIQIVNPYFLPTRSVRKEIKKAIKRGVEVEIMMSAKSDIKFMPDAALYVLNGLRKRGADIYLYEGGFHHSKIMMVDSLFCTIGTANLNSRSLRYDYEVNAFIFHVGTTHELIRIFEKDKLNCIKLTADVWKKRSVWKRFVGWFANWLTPFL